MCRVLTLLSCVVLVAALSACVVAPPGPRVWVPGHHTPAGVWVPGHYR